MSVGVRAFSRYLLRTEEKPYTSVILKEKTYHLLFTVSSMEAGRDIIA